MCALAAAARALFLRLSAGLLRAGAGWARLARGSMRPGKALRDDAARVPHLRLNCPTLAGAASISGGLLQLVNGALRVWMYLRRGAAVSGSARLGAAWQAWAGQAHLWRANGACALVPSTRVLWRWLCRRSQRARLIHLSDAMHPSHTLPCEAARRRRWL